MEQDSNLDDSILKSAREARRRKILENSNNRLSKITGRVHNEETPKVETIETNVVYPDPEIERDIFEASTVLNHGNANQDVFELLKTLQQEQINRPTEDTPNQKIPQSPLFKFIKSKYPVIIIALLVYSMFALNIERFIGSSVFALLILWEVFELILTAFIIKEPVQQNKLIILIGMFLGPNSHSFHILLKILGLINKILRDIAIFLFTLVFSHLLYSFTIVGESIHEILDKDLMKLMKDEL